MYTFEEILRKIEEAVRGIRFEHSPHSLFEPIEYTLALGGKRIRPALMLMAYNLYKEDVERALPTALGLEIFHNFTLLHDDLMDEADMRRNKPTVHKVWNANTAILSGDAMLIAAYQWIGQTEATVSVDEYLEMIRLKTAVLLACALKMGAILAHAPEADAEHLYQFGIEIGLAFQLQDDLLDVYGNAATFGKNIGGDAILAQWIGAEGVDPQEKIASVKAIYDELKLKELCEEKMRGCYEAGMAHLEALTIPAERLSVLKGVCAKLMNRES